MRENEKGLGVDAEPFLVHLNRYMCPVELDPATKRDIVLIIAIWEYLFLTLAAILISADRSSPTQWSVLPERGCTAGYRP